jgi:hypothetical protein
MSCETLEPKPVDDRILVKRQDLENILYCLTAEDALADGVRIVQHYIVAKGRSVKYRARGRFEARQWDGKKDPAWETWLGAAFGTWHDDPPQLRFFRPDGEWYAAIPGQWVIKYGDGDFQPLPPETFEKHYEPAQ